MTTPAKLDAPKFFDSNFFELSQTPASLSRLVINFFFIQPPSFPPKKRTFEQFASKLDPIYPSVIGHRFPKSKPVEYAFHEFVHDPELLPPPLVEKLRSERLKEFSDVNQARNVSRFVSHLIYEKSEYLDQVISLSTIEKLLYNHCRRHYALKDLVYYLQEMLPCIEILNETTLFIPNKEICVERFNPCHAN